MEFQTQFRIPNVAAFGRAVGLPGLSFELSLFLRQKKLSIFQSTPSNKRIASESKFYPIKSVIRKSLL